MNNQLIYTVTQLNNQSSTYLRNKFNNIWVRGEISSFKTYPSGYTYFTLKDNKSQVSCVSFNILNDIQDGLEVTINGDVDLYVAKGNYQIKVNSIFETGKGKLWLNYIKLKNKLEQEGLFSTQVKKDLPKFPKKIGIITSLNGSVIKDLVNIIKRRASYIKIIVRDTKVNGLQSSNDLLSGLNEFIEYKDVDVIIIARGGGSFEDLMGFNSENLTRRIYECTIPIISAVGHETDFTLCDFVSDFRASTPSEAAEIVCIDKVDINFQIDAIYNSLFKLIQSKVDKNKIIFEKFLNSLTRKNNYSIFTTKQNKVKYCYQSLNNSTIHKLNKSKIKLNLYKKIFSSISIDKIKKMGFALVKKNEVVIKNINDISVNEEICIELNNGYIKSVIKDIYEKK
tara:strand:+ start:102 stop:1289 length:1188 start_codon:yes stop_codon:yes gene_type:complete